MSQLYESGIDDTPLQLSNQHQYLKLKKQRSLFIKSIIAYSTFTLSIIILLIIFIIKNSTISTNIKNILSDIQSTNSQIYQLKHNTTMNLSNLNIKNISLNMKDLSNNEDLTLQTLQLPYLRSLNLNNTNISQLSDVKLPSVNKIVYNGNPQYFRVFNSIIGIQSFEQYFLDVNSVYNCTFNNLKNMQYKNGNMISFIANNLPQIQTINITSNSIQNVVIFDAPKLKYIRIDQTIQNDIFTTLQIHQNSGYDIELNIVGRSSSLILRGARVIDFNKINLKHALIIDLKNAELSNFDNISYQIDSLSFDNVTGIRSINLSKYAEISHFKIAFSQLQQLVVDPNTVFGNISEINIQGTNLKKFQNICSQNYLSVHLDFNDQLIEISNNNLGSVKVITLPLSIQYINNNNFSSVNSIHSGGSSLYNLPKLQKLKNNNFSKLVSANLNYSSLQQVSNNTFTKLEYLYLQNSKLNDQAVRVLIENNTMPVLKYINLMDNQIENVEEIKELIEKMFPDVSVDI